jgi:hypothetical protein
VKGAQTRSCSSPVLVQETAEEVASVHSAPVIRTRNGQVGGRLWWLQPSARCGRSVLCSIYARRTCGRWSRPTTSSQQPVQALGADCANPPFRVRIRSGVPGSVSPALPTLGAEHIVEAPGELRVPVAEQEAVFHHSR